MAEKQHKKMKDQSSQASDSPIKELLASSKPSAFKQSLPEGYIEAAKKQYSALISDFKKLRNEHQEQFRMLEMNRKERPKEKKDFAGGDLANDQSVTAIVRLLQIVEASDKEWHELRHLIDARYFLREVKQKQKSNSSRPLLQDVHECENKNVSQTQNMDDVKKQRPEGKKPNIPGKEVPEGASENTLSDTKEKSRKGSSTELPSSNHTTQGSRTYVRTDGESVQTSSASFREVSHRTDEMSQKAGDLGQTYHGYTDIQREQIQLEETTNISERPISIFLSRGKSKYLSKAREEYTSFLDKENQLYKGRVKMAWTETSDIEDVTNEQKTKAPNLFEHLKHVWENLKDKTSDAAKRLWTEFIVLTDQSPKSGKETRTRNLHHGGVPSASMAEIPKHPSQSERRQLRPIEKLFQKIELQQGKGRLEKAKGQFNLLLKRDDNFKLKFPDKHRELQVFMVNPEEYPYSPYQCLYDVLSTVTKTDPLYNEVWKEYFFLVTSDQQYIIAENCGQIFKTIYKKEIDSMVVPRKSYEELQNELVEKIKQIEELTTRLSKFASQQLTAGNPNIADLSDKHRPTKIGELYSELYDNEWSEAFEVIKALRHPNAEETESDYFEDVLNTLKDILMAAYEFSAERTDSHLDDLKHVMLCTITCAKKEETKTKSASDKQKDTEYDRFVTEHARKYRKDSAAYTVREASKVFQKERLPRVFKEKSDDPKVVAYIDKCIELTWYMRVQDPPMYLRCLQKEDPICKTEFAFHGRKGKTTSVCVWPALFLFEGGHLVTKGHVLPEP